MIGLVHWGEMVYIIAMPKGIQFDLEASTRGAQAKAIVRDSGNPIHEELFQTLWDKLDELTVIYGDEEEISEEAYISLVERVDKLYFDFVEATGGKEALIREWTRPNDNSPLRYKLVPP
jgi:hypothetical protein